MSTTEHLGDAGTSIISVGRDIFDNISTGARVSDDGIPYTREWVTNLTPPSSHRKSLGTITTVNATMFGGKSSHALHHMETVSVFYRRKYGPDSPPQVLYINHTNDTRPSPLSQSDPSGSPKEQPFSTHSRFITPDALQHIGAHHMKLSRLSDLSDETAKKYAEVVVDEAQFFPDLLKRCLYLAEKLGINVYALGLTLDFKRNKFGQLGDLALHADNSITLRDTYCFTCAKNGVAKFAIYNQRNIDTTGKQVETGADNYSAVCRMCYLEHQSEVAGATV